MWRLSKNQDQKRISSPSLSHRAGGRGSSSACLSGSQPSARSSPGGACSCLRLFSQTVSALWVSCNIQAERGK
ncbi:rCG63446 [Rattus norvegicus]|uniref:RCG63446 n=1 Tax=Rattus norvegicus TaxID=10116 RepID=A6HB25_RAT|nr:rCG63446 [Rattus norvegicus]